MDRFEAEVAISRKLLHPHIVRLHEIIRDQTSIVLIIDLCTEGDLLDLVIESEVGLDTQMVARFLWQMLSGLAYLHHHHFAHRDIKPDNYMLERTPSGDANVKLIDFGLARSLAKGELMYSKVGSLRYMAFEILSNYTSGYGIKCDLWSMGVNVFILCTGNSPWHSKSEYGILKEM